MFFPEDAPAPDNPDDTKVLLKDDPRLPQTPVMATIGPASFCLNDETGEVVVNLIPGMIKAGMSIVRINLAHVTKEENKRWCKALLAEVRNAAQQARQPVAVTVDLGGPKIRIGEVGSAPGPDDEGERYLQFAADDICILTTDPTYGVKESSYGKKDTKLSLKTEGIRLSTTNIKKGQDVSLDDGSFRLKVESVSSRGDWVDIRCKALNAWKVKRNKGVNFPGCHVTDSALTKKDYEDLVWLFTKLERDDKEQVIDYVSLSFVKSARDIDLLRGFLDSRCDARATKIIAKIETAEAVVEQDDYSVFRDILSEADGIMVARGDLGAEMPFEKVPEIQRVLIEKTHQMHKPVIVATQMLESMIDHPFATRAEVTDVANAILEGADVTMLSGETSVGCDPIAAVRTMKTIAGRAIKRVAASPAEPALSRDDPVQAIAHPVVEFAAELGAKAIVSFTYSGETPIQISHYWPKQPVIAITWERASMVRLRLYRGIYPVLIDYAPKNSDEHRKVCSRVLRDIELLTAPGDLAVVTLSMDPEPATQRETNALYLLKC